MRFSSLVLSVDTTVFSFAGKACLVLSWSEREELNQERRYRIQALSNETELQLWRVAFLLNLTRGEKWPSTPQLCP